jgi:hypothetical protein
MLTFCKSLHVYHHQIFPPSALSPSITSLTVAGVVHLTDQHFQPLKVNSCLRSLAIGPSGSYCVIPTRISGALFAYLPNTLTELDLEETMIAMPGAKWPDSLTILKLKVISCYD